jgi:hypothetical protein
MGTWSEVKRDAEARHHVTSTSHAAALGLGRSGFFAGAKGAGWEALFPGVRVAPGKAADLRTILVAIGDATGGTRSPPAAQRPGSTDWNIGPPPDSSW